MPLGGAPHVLLDVPRDDVRPQPVAPGLESLAEAPRGAPGPAPGGKLTLDCCQGWRSLYCCQGWKRRYHSSRGRRGGLPVLAAREGVRLGCRRDRGEGGHRRGWLLARGERGGEAGRASAGQAQGPCGACGEGKGSGLRLPTAQRRGRAQARLAAGGERGRGGETGRGSAGGRLMGRHSGPGLLSEREGPGAWRVGGPSWAFAAYQGSLPSW